MTYTEDQRAKVRQARYTAAAVIAAAGPALAIALSEGGVSKWIAFAVAVGGALTGAAGSAVAASKTRAQRADGMFEPAPEVVVPSPADQVIQALPTVVEQAAQAAAELDRVKQAAIDALGTAPGVGPLVKQAIESVTLPRV
ncbi:hypothetical protein [Mycolicibacterium mageritense]|uniref:Holin n=1 Tax=Mycolicibacterium mageritense TaxID=53462 RepID=A0AAI8XPW1_MYCME|nr:hypothetical protein [Mycolicibacterium mageritense]BDY33144.1 hypothetical protein hbim_07119 [Mycolicibacterium mageritense]